MLLTAYPEAQHTLDYKTLDLCRVRAGALIRSGGKFQRLVDPWRRPRHLVTTALSSVGTLADKLRIASLRRCLGRLTLEELYEQPEQTTAARLQEEGFSPRITERFFRPFFGGVFLDPDLETSSRLFAFVFSMFAQGDVALPAHGMAAIPLQLAERLPPETVGTNSEVARLEESGVQLTDGRRLSGRAIVLATESPAAARLLGDPPRLAARSVTCLYFAAERPPLDEPTLVLNGEGRGLVNNLCVPSQVSRSYAPPGAALISATVVGIPTLDDRQLEPRWRPDARVVWCQVQTWRHLRTYRIPFALPAQSPPRSRPSLNRRSGAKGCLSAATTWTPPPSKRLISDAAPRTSAATALSNRAFRDCTKGSTSTRSRGAAQRKGLSFPPRCRASASLF